MASWCRLRDTITWRPITHSLGEKKGNVSSADGRKALQAKNNLWSFLKQERRSPGHGSGQAAHRTAGEAGRTGETVMAMDVTPTGDRPGVSTGLSPALVSHAVNSSVQTWRRMNMVGHSGSRWLRRGRSEGPSCPLPHGQRSLLPPRSAL